MSSVCATVDAMRMIPTGQELAGGSLVNSPLFVADGGLEGGIRGFEVNSRRDNLARLCDFGRPSTRASECLVGEDRSRKADGWATQSRGVDVGHLDRRRTGDGGVACGSVARRDTEKRRMSWIERMAATLRSRWRD